jgi:cytochrome P450
MTGITADLTAGPAIYADLRRLAGSGPIHRVRLHGRIPAWLLTRPDDIASAAVHPALTSDDRHLRGGASSVKVGFMGMDGPDHTRLRRHAAAMLSPRRVRALRPYLQRVTDDAVEAVRPAGRADLVADVARPVAMRVICELLGIPLGERVRFEDLAAGMLRPTGDPAAARARLLDYLTRLPWDAPASNLTEREAAETAALLLVAGYQTTADLIGSAMLALLEHPAQVRHLLDETLRGRAMSELIRYCGPMAIGVSRYTKEPVVLAGTSLPPGERVVLGLGAANRDPVRFPEPDRLDLTREPVAHFSFGRGAHYCLGAALAELEAETAIVTMFRRLPGLRLAGQPAWHTTIFTGVAHLPVAFH